MSRTHQRYELMFYPLRIGFETRCVSASCCQLKLVNFEGLSVADGYRHALCQFELSDLLITRDMIVAERCTFEVCLLCRQTFVRNKIAFLF